MEKVLILGGMVVLLIVIIIYYAEKNEEQIHQGEDLLQPSEEEIERRKKYQQEIEAAKKEFEVAKKIGDQGESQVIQELKQLERNDGYYVIHNLEFKKGPYSKVQIDHLVISKFGVFVIETKNYSGYINGDTSDEYWTVHYSSGKSHTLYNPIKQNYGHVTVVKSRCRFLLSPNHSVISLDETAIYSIIVFTDRSILNITNKTEEIVIRVPELVQTIRGFQHIIFSDEATKTIYERFERLNTDPILSGKYHT